MWGDYSAWTACSVTCGGGTQTRTREQTTLQSGNGAICVGEATMTQNCSQSACPGEGELSYSTFTFEL